MGGGVWQGRGQGTFHPPCHVLHYHMVLRPEGTSQINACLTWPTLNDTISDNLQYILAPWGEVTFEACGETGERSEDWV